MTGVSKDPFFIITYLDNIIIYSRMAEEHLSHIKQVFEKLRNGHLLMKLSKCYFITKEIHYLWHILSTKGIRPLPSKTQAMNNMQPPKTVKQVFTFLGLIRYYRKFIKKFTKMTKPLTILTHWKVKFEWTPILHTAFLMLKESVTQHLSYVIWMQQNDTQSTQMHQMMHVEHNSHKNRMKQNFNSPSFAYFHGYTEKMEHHRTRSL